MTRIPFRYFRNASCKRIWLTLGVLLMSLALLPRVLPKQPLATRYPSSIALYDAHQNLLRLTLASDEQYRLWIPLERISTPLIDAVLLYEDRYFRWHPGINPFSLVRAAHQTYISGGRRIGGSTLTMQLARRYYRMDTRTVPGKLRQIVRALQLELLYTKREILEAYLNLVPYGGNVEGVGAASVIYFGKRTEKLSFPEALTLAVIPQNPAHRVPGRADEGLTQARNILYRLWLRRNPQAAQDRDLFTLPVVVRGPRELPFKAPHFVNSVLATRPSATEIHTTLDLNLQRLVERHVHAYISRQQRVGIRNGAALLVDHRDMAIKAAVGSADFFNEEIDGQVNALDAKRSPGSALKPFIYALAIDQGLIHPLTILTDSPQSFGPYSPGNFDGRFAGPVTATDALNRSRNVPAIGLAAKLGEPSFYGFLKAVGISRMSSDAHYGLALALGGVEVTMEELAKLYGLLANRGSLQPLRGLQEDKAGKGIRLLSEEAAFMTLDMMRQNPRPDRALINAESARLPVYWKTGTSYGFRDAWTAGVFGPYVLVVWIGNFDGTSNPAFVGVQAAAPLFFELVDSIQVAQPGLREPPHRQPPGLARVEVCAASGDLPNAHCPQRATTWFIPGKSPIHVSTLHRQVVIDRRTGLIACPPYRERETRTEVYEFWPSDMLHLFQQAGIPRRTPPPPSPQCAATNVGDVGALPRITSPLRGATYTLRLSKPEEQTIPLQATVDASVAEAFWFVNEKYAGKAARGMSLPWQPPGPGTYVLRVVDDAGRADSREVSVAVTQ